MSLAILALGTLTGDPHERTSSGGKTYVTANVRTATDDEPVMVSAIAFGETAKAALLALKKGDTVAVNGRGKLTSWAGKDGEQRHGLSVVADGVLTAYGVSSRRKTHDATEGR
ncbi:MAG: single-stranded DNA-binding protein [Nitrospiraceae bacterium]